MNRTSFRLATLAVAAFSVSAAFAQAIPKTALSDAEISAKLDPQMAVVINAIKEWQARPFTS